MLIPRQILYYLRPFTSRAHYVKNGLYALSDDRAVLVVYEPSNADGLDGVYEVDIKAALVGLRNGGMDRYISIPGKYARVFQGKLLTSEVLWDKLKFDGDGTGSIELEPGEVVKMHGFLEGLYQVSDRARLSITSNGLVLESKGDDHEVRVVFNGKPSGSAVASYSLLVLKEVTNIIGIRSARLLINKQHFGLFEYLTNHGIIRTYFAPLVE